MTLYEIDQSLLDIMEAVDPETGEWTGDPEAWERLNLERDVKLENTACYIKDLRGKIADFKAEIKALQHRQKTLENKEAWLLDNLKRSLDGTNFETTRCTVKFKRNPESVKYTDEGAAMQWAEEYAPDFVIYAKPTLSKAGIKALLKDGEQVPGAELVREMRMEVK